MSDMELRDLAQKTAELNCRLLHTVEMMKDLAELISSMEQGLADEDQGRHRMFKRLENIQNKSEEIIGELMEAKDGFVQLAVGDVEDS